MRGIYIAPKSMAAFFKEEIWDPDWNKQTKKQANLSKIIAILLCNGWLCCRFFTSHLKGDTLYHSRYPSVSPRAEIVWKRRVKEQWAICSPVRLFA